MPSLKLPAHAFFCIAYLFVALLSADHGQDNAEARFAMLEAAVYDHSLAIDFATTRTGDWAVGTDGHQYANKAPFPALLAMPFYYLWERTRTTFPSRPPAPDLYERAYLCFFVQILPFVLACFWALSWLSARIKSRALLAFAALALLFGNTAALLSGVFFGHTLAAALFLGVFLCLESDRPKLAGLLLGLAFCSDYAVPCILPAVLYFLLVRSNFRLTFAARNAGSLLLGALLPLALLGLYHWRYFGSPFSLPLQSVNPKLDPLVPSLGLLRPSSSALVRLVAGPDKGLLFTQPWVFFLLIPAARAEAGRSALIALLGLLWVSAAYGGWHGGWVAGPRYLSLCLPLAGVGVALSLDGRSFWLQTVAFLSLAFSILLGSLVFAVGVVVNPNALWTFYWGELSAQGFVLWVRVVLYFLPIVLASLLFARRRGIV